jgi:hypothetical protein
MAKFPVNPGDSQSAITDAINYTLSGPGGLGQNFKGFSSETVGDAPPTNVLAYLTGNFRPPFTQTTPASTYVSLIAISTAQYLDPVTIKFTFAATQPTPPFALGNGLEVGGVTPAGPYDGVYRGAGVLECTTTYVIIRVTGDGTTPAPGTGGFINFNPFGGGAFVSTDANAKVTVNGATDRVFVSAQLNSILTYTATGPTQLTYTVMINRQVAVPNDDPTNPDFTFAYDKTIAVKNYNVTVDATATRVYSLSVTSGISHVPRTTYPRVYSVPTTAVTGSGTLLTLGIELRPNIAESSVGLSSGGPYFTPGPATTYRTGPWNFKNITAAVGSGTVCTVTLTNSAPAFVVGQSVTISGTSSPSFDGTYQLTAASPTQIQFASTVAGTATLTSATANAAFYNTVITILDPGNGYAVGDTVRVLGSDIGGADGTNDMILTIDQITTGTATLPPTTFANWYSPVEIETTFTAVIDTPPIGYYWYRVELEVDITPGIGADAVINQVEFGYRTLSAQVVKA